MLKVGCLAKTVASYNPIIKYDAIPVSRGKRLLEDYYAKVWNAVCINSEKASHTKPLIPSICYRLSIPPLPAKPHPHTTPNKPWLLSLVSP